MSMKRLVTYLRQTFPLIDLLVYYRAARRAGLVHRGAVEERFRNLVLASTGRRCLQIGARGQRFGRGWTVVDLHDPSPVVDVRDDVQRLRFSDGTFDLVVCNAVLECVENPRRAIRELRRVLRPGGEIWVEVPFIQAFHPSPQGWNDYWRVTLPGLRLWMRDFEELASGFYGNPIWNGVYFHGRRPLGAAAAMPAPAPPRPPLSLPPVSASGEDRYEVACCACARLPPSRLRCCWARDG
jgi:SAM-dependent methyltransferase